MFVFKRLYFSEKIEKYVSIEEGFSVYWKVFRWFLYEFFFINKIYFTYKCIIICINLFFLDCNVYKDKIGLFC